MCRILGYVGAPIRLGELLEQAPHSLERQSYAARELNGAVVCADGWGVGFYVPGDDQPCLYRSTLPIWADANRTHLGRALRSKCVLACVRSATDPLSVSMANTPPFTSGELMLVHNGAIRDFSSSVARHLEQGLSDRQYQRISGRTDSEYLLATIADDYAGLNQGHPQERLAGAVRTALNRVRGLTAQAKTQGLFTLLVSDGRQLVATRASHGEIAPPTLYLLEGAPQFGGGFLVASEPLDSTPGWRAVEENELWIFRDSHAQRCEL